MARFEQISQDAKKHRVVGGCFDKEKFSWVFILKKLRTFVIPAKAGIGAKKFKKYLIGARCARFRVPIPACAGMTIFVNKNCKKYFDKLLFI